MKPHGRPGGILLTLGGVDDSSNVAAGQSRAGGVVARVVVSGVNTNRNRNKAPDRLMDE